jgi:hypothetical protein
MRRSRSLRSQLFGQKALQKHPAPSRVAIRRRRGYRDNMILHISRTRTALRQHGGIGREGRAVPGCIGKVEIATFAGAIPVSREHFTRVQIGVAFSPDGVDAAFEEDELADEHKGKNDMDEDSRWHSTGKVAPVGHLEDLFGGDDPDAEEAAEEEDLGEEDEECPYADSTKERFVLE